MKNAVIDGVFPQYSVIVYNIPFTFQFTDVPFPRIHREQLQFMENHVSCRQIPGVQFIKELPPMIYKALIMDFVEMQEYVGDCLCTRLDEFVATGESRNYWEMFKVTRPELVLTFTDGQLNALQRRWVLFNIRADKKDTATLIGQVFEAAKPWLNSELFAKVQEQEQDTRENVFFDDNNMEDIDKELRQKAKNAVKKTSADAPDLDEISIDGDG